MSAFVLARKCSQNTVFFQYPDKTTFELRTATKFDNTENDKPGFFYMTLEKAATEIRKMMMRDG